MENKYPWWLEFSALALLLLNIPLVIIETFPVSASIPVHALEWVFTGLFTLEYVLRIVFAQSRKTYVFSFSGIIDLLATLPQYLLLVFPLAQELFLLRLLRIFRLVVKGYKASRSGRELLERALDLKDHFALDERIVQQTRMSRLYFCKAYVFLIILALAAGAGAILAPGPILKGIPVVSATLYVLLVICVIVLLKREIYVVSHRYAVTNYRILSSTNVFEQNVTSVSMLQVTDIALHQGLVDRLLGVGTVIVRTSGEVNAMELVGIRHPLETKQLIQQAIITLNTPKQA